MSKPTRFPIVVFALFALMPCSMASADFFNQDTIQRFAPLLVMDSREDNGPSSAPWFIDRSRLAFSEHGFCENETVYAGPWTVSATRRLGLLVPRESRWQYRTKQSLLCNRSGPVLLATDYTRPYDSHRHSSLHKSEGFFFTANLTGAKGGMPFTQTDNHEFVTQAPIYYDDGELFNENGSRKNPKRAYISYWFFYPFNDAPRAKFLFNHQGDWENISLLFLRGSDSLWTLEEVSYSAHGAPKPIAATCPAAPPDGDRLTCPVPRTTWAGQSRLVGFVADGSHATYSSSGPHPIHSAHGLATDRTSSISSGYSWPTWKNLLPLEAQGWAGFCGAWGNVGKSYLPFPADRTGPLGPGCLDEEERQRKRGGPGSWGVPRSSPGDRAATPGEAIGVDPLQ
ncbi:MAG TPA: hypothetical protein VF093_12055 [Solirubrobacterales bacterium]